MSSTTGVSYQVDGHLQRRSISNSRQYVAHSYRRARDAATSTDSPSVGVRCRCPCRGHGTRLAVGPASHEDGRGQYALGGSPSQQPP